MLSYKATMKYILKYYPSRHTSTRTDDKLREDRESCSISSQINRVIGVLRFPTALRPESRGGDTRHLPNTPLDQSIKLSRRLGSRFKLTEPLVQPFLSSQLTINFAFFQRLVLPSIS